MADWMPPCSYCGAAAGYAASCRDATVWVCKAHVGSACAIWLYDMGFTAVEVRRLEVPKTSRSASIKPTD